MHFTSSYFRGLGIRPPNMREFSISPLEEGEPVSGLGREGVAAAVSFAFFKPATEMALLFLMAGGGA